MTLHQYSRYRHDNSINELKKVSHSSLMGDEIMEGRSTTPQTMTSVTGESRNTDLFVFDDYNQRTAIATVICIVFLAGSVGNTLVITAVVLSRKLRSSTNWFVVNLGCSDLLTCLSLPFNIVAILSRNGWPLPDWICAVNSAVIHICLGASVMTLALIAYNRWFLLTKTRDTFKKLYKTRNICFMVLSAWLYPALLVLVPHFAGLGQLGYSYEYKICTQDTSLPNSDLYSLIAGVGAIIPVFIAIVVIYVRIYLFISKQNKKIDQLKKGGTSETRGIDNANVDITSSEIPSTVQMNFSSDETIKQSCSTLTIIDISQPKEMCIDKLSGVEKIAAIENIREISQPKISENQSGQSPEKGDKNLPRCSKRISTDLKAKSQLNKYNVKVTKRLAIVVFAFFICLLPIGISVLVPSSDPGIPWTGLMLTFNSCVNPVIYARTMPEFRKVMLAIIRCRLKDIPDPIASIFRFR